MRQLPLMLFPRRLYVRMSIKRLYFPFWLILDYRTFVTAVNVVYQTFVTGVRMSIRRTTRQWCVMRCVYLSNSGDSNRRPRKRLMSDERCDL